MNNSVRPKYYPEYWKGGDEGISARIMQRPGRITHFH